MGNGSVKCGSGQGCRKENHFKGQAGKVPEKMLRKDPPDGGLGTTGKVRSDPAQGSGVSL